MNAPEHKPPRDRQERFVHEDLIDHNASAAAGRAGYPARTKGTHAAWLMKNSP
ncbi:MAG TPA: terminase small subunit [Burkholderiales bacterium]|jgi:phage terminase small subunit